MKTSVLTGLRSARALLAGAALAGSLQGCGLMAVSHAGYLEHQDLRAANGDLSRLTTPKECDIQNCPSAAQLPTGAVPERERVLLSLPPARPQAKPDDLQPLQRAGIAQARSNAELAAVLLPMAYLSNVVYHRHEASRDRSDPALACDAGRQAHPMGPRLLALPMPPIAPEAPSPALYGGWRRWGSAQTHCTAEADTGIFYDTYLRVPGAEEAGTAPLQVAIVFRGTENDLRQAGFDWTDNFLAAFGLTPRQYVRAIERLRITMEALAQLEAQQQALGRELHIYAAGHSLGGGLAQQAGYLHRKIRAVYAFNTSAVTNWTQLRLWDGGVHIQNPEPVIVRVGQEGEALDFLRAITTPFNLARFHRVDVLFHYTNRGAVRNHSIARLSCHLAARVAAGAASAGQFGDTQAMARAILQEPQVDQAEVGCDQDMREEICRHSPYLGLNTLLCSADRHRPVAEAGPATARP